MDLEFARFTGERRRCMMVNTKGKVNYYRKERGSADKNIRIRKGVYLATSGWLSVLIE
jgi:hypothetical protein